MMRGALTIGTFISVILFPWPLTAFLVLVSSLYVPLIPLAAGIFADTLYYAPQASLVPVCTMLGAVISIVALFVRSRLMAGIIR